MRRALSLRSSPVEAWLRRHLTEERERLVEVARRHAERERRSVEVGIDAERRSERLDAREDLRRGHRASSAVFEHLGGEVGCTRRRVARASEGDDANLDDGDRVCLGDGDAKAVVELGLGDRREGRRLRRERRGRRLAVMLCAPGSGRHRGKRQVEVGRRGRDALATCADRRERRMVFISVLLRGRGGRGGGEASPRHASECRRACTAKPRARCPRA